MSFLSRVWNTIRRPRFFVGTDLEGNRFFEYPSTSDDIRRTKRRVKYKVYEDMWHYIGGSRKLPVQWVSWMSHTRPDPPTLEELRADLVRQRRVLHNATVLEARDREEHARITAAISDPISSAIPSQPPVHESVIASGRLAASGNGPLPTDETVRSAGGQGRRPKLPSDLPLPARDEKWQPQPWAPQATQQRGE
ncbi:hypothetical protein OF83DRAFT_1134118 [Amylostereum chailletii]|nr:hypothetical protein OF83DRAFT_1134118 [Amylostereum chailletii]